MVHSVEINRSPADVFAYVTDPSRFTEWQDAVVRASLEGDGPLQEGSQIQLTRKMGMREQTMTSDLTDCDEPHSYAFRVTEGPVRAVGKGRFEALDDGHRRGSRSSSTSRATASASCSCRYSSAGKRRGSCFRATRA